MNIKGYLFEILGKTCKNGHFSKFPDFKFIKIYFDWDNLFLQLWIDLRYFSFIYFS